MRGPSGTYNSGIKQWIIDHRHGLMGTIIFHLLLAIMLVSMGISRIGRHTEMEIMLEMPEPEIIQQKQEEQKRKEEIVRKSSDEEVEKLLRSMAVNEDVKQNKQATVEQIDQYIQEIQDELRDGYGDRYAVKKDKNHRSDSLLYQQERRQRELDSLQSTLYVGESSVSYKLKDRYQRYLPIPVFKCEFGGKVVVNIVVNRKGSVLKAEIVEAESQQDDCLREVAVDAALRSRFNEDNKAPERQSGTITYHFVKQ